MQRLPPRLAELLLAIRDTGSLAAACRQTGLSYRYAWGTLREARRLFGQPLLRADVRFIHRQLRSGTRLLLECLVAQQSLPLRGLHGTDMEELTHAAVAAYVASGLADAGFGLEPPALRYGMAFIPIVSERYFLLCRRAALDSGHLPPPRSWIRCAAIASSTNSACCPAMTRTTARGAGAGAGVCRVAGLPGWREAGGGIGDWGFGIGRRGACALTLPYCAWEGLQSRRCYRLRLFGTRTLWQIRKEEGNAHRHASSAIAPFASRVG
ncbi:substrate-binding domain-containing protein [Xanthomonas translucens]|uniref:substrate-binding domain-containing protein n=1 Tax=Xanthomonas campestris pv. translucens TaxID=343 RepID=UPI0030C7FA41